MARLAAGCVAQHLAAPCRCMLADAGCFAFNDKLLGCIAQFATGVADAVHGRVQVPLLDGWTHDGFETSRCAGLLSWGSNAGWRGGRGPYARWAHECGELWHWSRSCGVRFRYCDLHVLVDLALSLIRFGRFLIK